MKNKSLIALIALTVVFLVFIAGYAVGILSDRTIIISDNAPITDSVDPTIVTYIDGMIDINCATLDDLVQIPNIGETIAQNIITYRNENGPFASVYDLLKVEGIGNKRLEILLDYITVQGG